MAGEYFKEARRSMFKRVCAWTQSHEHFGLLCEFSRRTSWMLRPIYMRQQPEQVRNLDHFLHALEMEPHSEDLSDFHDFLKRNEGQPRSVRALNTLEERDGREGEWGDNARKNSPSP
jgi:hypothetical protein